MNRIKLWQKGQSNRLRSAIIGASTLFSAIKHTAASAGLLGEIAQNLKFKPHSWLKARPGNEWHAEMMTDIRDIYPNLPNDSRFFICTLDRITLIYSKGAVLPIIFKNIGGITKLHRLVVGNNMRWLETIFDELQPLLGDKHSVESPPPMAIAKIQRRTDFNPVGIHGFADEDKLEEDSLAIRKLHYELMHEHEKKQFLGKDYGLVD